MGRRSSRPAPPRRPAASAPRRPASSSARAAAPAARSAPPPAPASAAAPPPAPAAAAAPGGSAMGGFMANVASTAAGVTIGRGIDRALFGGGGGGGSGDAHAEPAQGHAYPAEQGSAEGQIPESVCAREVLEFKKCLDRSGHQVAECQWNLDLLSQCQAQAAHNAGFAEAPRL